MCIRDRHYGSSVFEGIRAYALPDGPAVFRGPEHFERLIFSCKVAHIPSPYSVEEYMAVSYTHLRAHETVLDLVCRLLLEKKKIRKNNAETRKTSLTAHQDHIHPPILLLSSIT